MPHREHIGTIWSAPTSPKPTNAPASPQSMRSMIRRTPDSDSGMPCAGRALGVAPPRTLVQNPAPDILGAPAARLEHARAERLLHADLDALAVRRQRCRELARQLRARAGVGPGAGGRQGRQRAGPVQGVRSGRAGEPGAHLQQRAYPKHVLLRVGLGYRQPARRAGQRRRVALSGCGEPLQGARGACLSLMRCSLACTARSIASATSLRPPRRTRRSPDAEPGRAVGTCRPGWAPTCRRTCASPSA